MALFRQAATTSEARQPPAPLDVARTHGPDTDDPRFAGWPCNRDHQNVTVMMNAAAEWSHCGVCGLRMHYTPREKFTGEFRKAEALPETVTAALTVIRERDMVPNQKTVKAMISQIQTAEQINGAQATPDPPAAATMLRPKPKPKAGNVRPRRAAGQSFRAASSAASSGYAEATPAYPAGAAGPAGTPLVEGEYFTVESWEAIVQMWQELTTRLMARQRARQQVRGRVEAQGLMIP